MINPISILYLAIVYELYFEKLHISKKYLSSSKNHNHICLQTSNHIKKPRRKGVSFFDKKLSTAFALIK